MARRPGSINGKWIAIPFAVLVLAAIPLGFWVRSALEPDRPVYLPGTTTPPTANPGAAPSADAAAGDEPARGEGARVAALSPAVALIMTQIGLGDLIVARHGYDQWSDAALPVAGDQAGLDYEALLGVEPTDVLLEWGSRDLPARLVDLGSARGWSVRTYRLLTLEDVAGVADALHARFGGSGPAPSEAFWAALRPREGAGRAGRVLLLTSATPPQALGPGSAHHEMLVRLGGTPAITEGSAWIELDAEDVLRLAPDAIVLIQPGAPEGAPALGALAGLPIPAVVAGRVGVIRHETALVPSLALGEVADRLGALLEGWSAEE